MKQNKYIYLWIVQGRYGLGWEDVDASESYREARESLKAYRTNEPKFPHRLIKRREVNPEYKEESNG